MLDGFVYPIVKDRQLDCQLAFSVSTYEHYRGWCGLQSAYLRGEVLRHRW